ncbi:hypothetical protein D1AOALGA4SA_9102 [Olavius algarvensis Delta 1 endosymbiont]|nr:hypothetical protein D1AOALGA4SA_9102 [Olavius algarvensis Delta 1 endosymbiont]
MKVRRINYFMLRIHSLSFLGRGVIFSDHDLGGLKKGTIKN